MSQMPRSLRACLVCSFVQAYTKFEKQGCPNCEEFLEMRGSRDTVLDVTSEVFEGLITVNDTNGSWVAKWQRLQGYVPGVYAVQVNGTLPDDYIQAAENAGVSYAPRDGSGGDERE